MKYDNPPKPLMSDAQVWQLAQDVQNAYRAALKPPLILPSGLEDWLGQETKEIGL